MSDRLYTLTVQFEEPCEYEAAAAYAGAHLPAWPGAECAYVANEMTIIATGNRGAMIEPMKALAQHIAEEAWEGSLALTQKLLTPAEEAAREGRVTAAAYVSSVNSRHRTLCLGLAGCDVRRAGESRRGMRGLMEAFGREPAEVRIPRAALDAMAAALSVRTVAMRTWPDGIGWMYPLGTWDEPHVEVALMPGGEEVWLRMSTDRSSVVVWTIEQWWDFAGELPGATPPA